MKRFNFIGLLSSILICTQVSAQEDSLLSELGYYDALENPSMDDTLIIRELGTLVNEVAYVDPSKGHFYSYALYDLSKRIGYKKGVADGLHFLADTKFFLGEFDSGIDFADEAIAYSKANKIEKGILDGYMTKGNGYYYKGMYDLATEQYF